MLMSVMCSYHCAQYTTQHSSDNLLLSSRQLMFIIAQVLSVEGSGVWKIIIRVTTCMENLKMSGILTSVSEMSGILRKVREKILSGKTGLKLLLAAYLFACF